VKNIYILNVYIKFGTKLFYLTWEKKRNLKQVIGKMKNKIKI